MSHRSPAPARPGAARRGGVETDDRIPVLLSWSGGKDSSLALHDLLASETHRPVGLLTTVTEEFDRISMHGVRHTLLRRQAEQLGLHLSVVLIPPDPSDTSYRDRMGAALIDARKQGIEAVAFGDLFLQDVRVFREAMIAAAGMTAIFPLWGRPTTDLARTFVELGFRATLTCVDTTQIPAHFAGREYDAQLLAELPAGADPCGENGEFHTFVHAGPLFPEPIQVTRGEHVLREGRFMYCDLVPG
jgi:uncharacterized protein (TIGR00290 family)